MGINLDKFESDFASKDATLVSLVKKSGITLDKHNLRGHIAKVAVCLDISGSMHSLYSQGKIAELVKKLIPIGLQFDDDGEIDIFTFGANGTQRNSMNLENYSTELDGLAKYSLEGYTNYAKAITLVDNFYRSQDDVHQTPVYVMFITDGDASDKKEATQAMKKISDIPVFVQFIALGADYMPSLSNKDAVETAKPKGFFGKMFGSSDSTSSTPKPPSNFQFLCDIDDMSGRKVDNANFFAIKTPTSISEEVMYDLLMTEYPDFIKEAKSKGVLR